MKLYKGKQEAFGLRVGVVGATFNPSLADPLFNSVVSELKSAGVKDEDIIGVRVPGALELPGTIVQLLQNNELDLVFALGVVVQGETVHFDHVTEQSVRGIVDLTTRVEIPIVNGVLAGTAEQMKDRVLGGRAKAKPFVETGVEMASLYRQL